MHCYMAKFHKQNFIFFRKLINLTSQSFGAMRRQSFFSDCEKEDVRTYHKGAYEDDKSRKG